MKDRSAIHRDEHEPTRLAGLPGLLEWRQELLAVLLVLAESALVYLVTGLVLTESAPGAAVLPAWIVVMLMLTAYVVPHLLDEWRTLSPEYESIMAAGIVATLLVAIKAGSFPDVALWDLDWLRGTVRALALLPADDTRPVWGIVLLGAYAWWRGRTRADASVDSAYSMLRTGTFALALIIIVILIAADGDAQVRDRLSAATVAFFVSALAAVGVARLRLEGFCTSGPLGPRWLTTFVLPIVVVVTLAILAAGIFSRQFLDTLLWMLTPVFLVLHFVFQVFVLVLAVMAYVILTPIVWLIGEREPRVLQTTPTTTIDDTQSLLERAGDAASVPDPLRYLIAALLLFVIFSALTRFVFRRKHREREAVVEERDSVLEWSNLFGALTARMRGLRRKRETTDPLAHLRGDPRWRHTLRIRETYLKFQDRGREAGRPRRPAETADEYGADLTRRIAVEQDVPLTIATITDIYRDARYSGEPADERDAERIEESWRRLT